MYPESDLFFVPHENHIGFRITPDEIRGLRNDAVFSVPQEGYEKVLRGI